MVRDEISVKGVVSYLLHLQKLYVLVAVLGCVLVVEQSGLFDGDDLVLGAVHHEEGGGHLLYVVDVGEVVLQCPIGSLSCMFYESYETKVRFKDDHFANIDHI